MKEFVIAIAIITIIFLVYKTFGYMYDYPLPTKAGRSKDQSAIMKTLDTIKKKLNGEEVKPKLALGNSKLSGGSDPTYPDNSQVQDLSQTDNDGMLGFHSQMFNNADKLGKAQCEMFRGNRDAVCSYGTDITEDDAYPEGKHYKDYISDIGVTCSMRESHKDYLKDMETLTQESKGWGHGILNNMDDDFGSVGMNNSFVGMRYPQKVPTNNPDQIIDVDLDLLADPNEKPTFYL